jgi:hypothetical protein
MKKTFRERAQQLGHSLDMLDAGMTVTTTITVNTVDDLKKAVRMFLGDDQPPDLATQLFGDIPLGDPEVDGTAEGTLRRVNEFVYGNSDLHPKDRERIKSAFPLDIEATSAEPYTPTAPVLIHNPVKPQHFNYGTVTLNQGIYINIYNTVVTMFTMDNLVRNGDNGNPNIGDINIFGATGTSPGMGATGAVGPTGTAGTSSSCTVSGSEPGDAGGPGGTGGTGITGGPGDNGGTGQPSMQAIFTINDSITSANPVLFFTRSGTGGSGGQGGRGGTGGRGGDGAGGATCECTGTNGGNAGNGGTGGTGGRGGDAGNAVNAAGNITVNLPKAYQNKVTKNEVDANPGNYGEGGPPGAGGGPGNAGGAGKHCNGGATGNNGVQGAIGDHGNSSSVTGKKATITFSVF